MEELVFEKVSAVMSGMNTCRCNKCYYDVCALVLNNLDSQQYVTSQEGALIKRASFMNMEVLTNFSVVIFKAIDVVQKKPQHYKY